MPRITLPDRDDVEQPAAAHAMAPRRGDVGYPGPAHLAAEVRAAQVLAEPVRLERRFIRRDAEDDRVAPGIDVLYLEHRNLLGVRGVVACPLAERPFEPLVPRPQDPLEGHLGASRDRQAGGAAGEALDRAAAHAAGPFQLVDAGRHLQAARDE